MKVQSPEKGLHCAILEWVIIHAVSQEQVQAALWKCLILGVKGDTYYLPLEDLQAMMI